jgi:predicted dienelactone hydrolase
VATTTDPLVAPPYPITEVTLHLVDASRPTVSHGRTISRVRSLVTRVWLPTVARRWPLVVFAHGFEVGPGPYETMLEAWAAHGYVVAASEFPLTDAALAGTNLDESDIDNQPADLRFVADSLVAGTSPVAARIDAARVAVAGHSDGGEVALAASLAPTPAGQPVYRAVIAMSVQPVGTAPTRNPPILVLQGDADTINPPTRGYQTWDRAASPKYLLILHGAEHLPPLQAGSAWLPGIEAETEAFLDAYVAGDGSASQVRSAVAGAPLMSLQSG